MLSLVIPLAGVLCSCALIVDNVVDSRVPVAPLPYTDRPVAPLPPQPPALPASTAAVWQLTALNGVSPDLMAALTDTLRAALLKTRRFQIIARGQMEDVIRGQNLALSMVCDTTDCAVEYGQILSVEKIVVGSVSWIGSTHQVVLKLVEVGTGRIERTGTQRALLRGEEELFELVDRAAKELAADQ